MAQKGKMGKREAELAKDGWTKQTTYDEPRLSELVAAYEEAGLEVRLEEPDEETARECNACFAGGIGKLKTIYTREKKGTREQGNRGTGKHGKGTRKRVTGEQGTRSDNPGKIY